MEAPAGSRSQFDIQIGRGSIRLHAGLGHGSGPRWIPIAVKFARHLVGISNRELKDQLVRRTISTSHLKEITFLHILCVSDCGAPFAVPASGAFVGVWAWLWGVACVYLAYFVGGVED